MRVLFLDIDGVLNTEGQTTRFGKDFIDPDKALMINSLCVITGACIVISSDWRLPTNDGFEGTVAFLREAGITVPIIGMTPIIEVGNSEWTKITLDDHRRNEIRRWLDEHEGIESFAVVDDLQMRGSGVGGHAVQTSGFHGVQPKHIRKLQEILTR